MEIGEFGTADAVLVQATAEADALGERPVSITADLVRLQLHLRSESTTSIDDVMQQTLDGIRDLEGTDDANALARAWRLLTLAYGVSGRYGEAGDANEKAIDYARRAGDRVIEARLHASSAMVAFYGPTPVSDAIAVCEGLLRLGDGDRRAQATTLAALAHLRAMVGDFERAREDYRVGRATLEELGLLFDAHTISIDSGPVELLAGDPSAAEVELRKDYQALDAMGERNYISTIAGLLAEALYRQGRFEEAGTYASVCEDVAAASDVYSQYLWRGIRGKLLARDGSHDEGIELARSGVVETRASDDIEGQGNALVFLAEAQAAAGRVEDAAESRGRGARAVRAEGQRRVCGADRRAAVGRGRQPVRSGGVPGLGAGDGTHRIDADDDRRERVERELIADLAAAQQLAEERTLAARQADVHVPAVELDLGHVVIRAVDRETAPELVHRHVRAALDEAPQLRRRAAIRSVVAWPGLGRTIPVDVDRRNGHVTARAVRRDGSGRGGRRDRRRVWLRVPLGGRHGLGCDWGDRSFGGRLGSARTRR